MIIVQSCLVYRDIIFTQKNRQLCPHEGLSVYIRSDIKGALLSNLTIYRDIVFDSLVLRLRLGVNSCYLIILYPPPTSSYNEFFDPLEEQPFGEVACESPLFSCGRSKR